MKTTLALPTPPPMEAPLKLQLELSPEQFALLAEQMVAQMVAAKMALRAPKRMQPYEVPEAATEMGLSASTVRRMVAAGTLATATGTERTLVLAEAVRAFQCGMPCGPGDVAAGRTPRASSRSRRS